MTSTEVTDPFLQMWEINEICLYFTKLYRREKKNIDTLDRRNIVFCDTASLLTVNIQRIIAGVHFGLCLTPLTFSVAISTHPLEGNDINRDVS